MGGPSGYSRAFCALVGSVAAGLMLDSCIFFFALGDGHTHLLDYMLALLEGKGYFVGYVCWWFFVVFGAVRYHLSQGCGLYTIVYGVRLTSDCAIAAAPGSLQRPLLDTAQVPPPIPRKSKVVK